MYETLLYEKDNGVAVLALNRPEVLNAFNGQLHQDLHDALDNVSNDDEIRCVMIRGEGRGFSAGADLKGKTQSGTNTIRPTPTLASIFAKPTAGR